ncbi:hypothetical protein BDZ97DRAFT_2026666 [Flammula alnicola]|nr:hypothetical protein BDZ97DRAFT_2026666 [Flammula alnicola]
MPFHELPPELLWAVVSHLAAEGDYPSLYACALTCRALVSPAQAGIFHTISMHLEDPFVLAKLESTPHIRTLTKHLDLWEIHKPWIQHSEVLHRMLDILSPYIVSFHIFQRRSRPGKPRFNFPSLSQLTRLEEISLREEEWGSQGILCGNNPLPTFFNQFPNLRAITFDYCLVKNQTIDGKSAIAAPVFQLERLDVLGCKDTLVLEWLIPALSSLRRLHFSYHASNASVLSTIVPQFMSTAGESLQHLEVVVQSFLLIGAHPHLQHLTIVFHQSDAPVDGSPWGELQDLLLGTGFPELRSVELRLLVNSESNLVSTEPFVAAVPRLAQRRMISNWRYRGVAIQRGVSKVL